MSSSKKRISSEPYTEQKKQQIKQEQLQKMSRSAFPTTYTFSGFLYIKTESHPSWRQKYFVLNNNFLLCGDNPYSERLAACIPLEGCDVRRSDQMEALTFSVMTHSQDASKRKKKKSKKSSRRRKKKYDFRSMSQNMMQRWIEHIERASTLSIKDLYRLRYKLGNSDSQSAKVIAAKHRVSNQEVAIKIVDKRKCDQQTLQREIQILRKLRHTNIVKLEDLFETRKYLYIVMEFCRGGELFDKIANLEGDHFSEGDCCQIMHQLASGIQYMHKMGIVHRDLKPENILVDEWTEQLRRVKIADFGISAMIDGNIEAEDDDAESANLRTRVGTLSYTAPEILGRKPYDHRVDYWSLGIIMHILCSGYPPFDGESDYEVSDAITNDRLEFEEEDWSYISESTQTLVRRLLSKNPDERANCGDIVKHIWKVEVSGSGWEGARNRLKQTIIKRKYGQRSSYDDSTLALYQEEMKKSSRTMGSSKHSARRKRKQNGHGMPKKGRDDNILQCMAPMNYRDSFVVAEMKDEDEFSVKKQAHSVSSDSRHMVGIAEEAVETKSERHRQRTSVL